MVFKTSIFPYILGALIAFFGYQALATVMYTRALIDFYGIEDWSFEKHGIATNGISMAFGDMISVTDLAAYIPVNGGTVDQLCSHTQSQRGHLTLSVVGETPVCCWAEENQWLVPFKQDEHQRHYLCGSWPHLDYVSMPLEHVKIRLTP